MPVIMPAMITTGVEYLSSSATLQPITVKAIRPMASSTRKILCRWCMKRATSMVNRPAPMVR
ncbi:hypothetical protein D3C75_913330 [compost metagenome]